MGDYEIVIHRRGSLEPVRIPLPDIDGDVAESDRETLKYDIEQGLHAEAPSIPIRTASGHPAEPLTINPHEVTEVDLISLPFDDNPEYADDDDDVADGVPKA